MTATWIDRFRTWMRYRGVVSQGRPSRPMSQNTIRVYLVYIRTVMTDMGYLGSGRNLRNITARQVIDFMMDRWPDLGASDPNVYNKETAAVRKLAEFVHFEVRDRRGEPVLSLEDVDAIKRGLPKAQVEPRGVELTEDFLARLQLEFFPWLRENEPEVYAITAWMFYTEMRFNEARNVHVYMDSLDRGSAVRVNASGLPDPAGDHLQVERKRKAGRRVVQKLAPLPPLWPMLDWWLDVREDRARRGVGTLFISTRGEQWGSSNSLTRALKKAGKRSGLFSGSCNYHGDNATGEISLLKTHTVGRKAGITFDVHAGASEVDAMKRSGHTDPKVFHRHYPKVDPASSTRRIAALHERYWMKRNGSVPDLVNDVDDRTLVNGVLADMSLEDRKAVLRDLVDGLTA